MYGAAAVVVSMKRMLMYVGIYKAETFCTMASNWLNAGN